MISLIYIYYHRNRVSARACKSPNLVGCMDTINKYMYQSNNVRKYFYRSNLCLLFPTRWIKSTTEAGGQVFTRGGTKNFLPWGPTTNYQPQHGMTYPHRAIARTSPTLSLLSGINSHPRTEQPAQICLLKQSNIARSKRKLNPATKTSAEM